MSVRQHQVRRKTQTKKKDPVSLPQALLADNNTSGVVLEEVCNYLYYNVSKPIR